MGESDVKFMRYISLLGDIVVDSIDSDVLLISLLFVQSNDFKNNVYVRRYKIQHENTAVATKEKRKRQPKKKEYDVIDTTQLTKSLYECVYEAVGREVMFDDKKLAFCLVIIVLLTGTAVSLSMSHHTCFMDTLTIFHA